MSLSDPNFGNPEPLAELRLRKPPFWLISFVLISAVATLVPLALVARARFNTSPDPRIHIFQDMGNQPKMLPQAASTVFADGRSDRPVIEGTVSREAVLGDEHYTQGWSRDGKGAVTFFTGFPERMKMKDAENARRIVARGQERFNIYCSSCHGVDGRGNGIVNIRAQQVSGTEQSYGTVWIPPANLHDETRRGRPEGHIFNTITNGIRNMGGLGHQISVDDRWAIVAYVRALQLTDNAPASLLPADARNMLK